MWISQSKIDNGDFYDVTWLTVDLLTWITFSLLKILDRHKKTKPIFITLFSHKLFEDHNSWLPFFFQLLTIHRFELTIARNWSMHRIWARRLRVGTKWYDIIKKRLFHISLIECGFFFRFSFTGFECSHGFFRSIVWFNMIRFVHEKLSRKCGLAFESHHH